MLAIEYEYYIYESNKTSLKLINDSFNFGLLSTKGPSLDVCMKRVDKTIQLQTMLLNSDAKLVYVIKIPKMFLEPIIKDGQMKQIPIPIWEQNIDGTYILKSNLIHGAYDTKNNKYINNSYYNEVYYPIGLQFDNRQVEYFKNSNQIRWIKFDIYRKDKTLDMLQSIDREFQIWETAHAQYTSFYNNRIVKSLNVNKESIK